MKTASYILIVALLAAGQLAAVATAESLLTSASGSFNDVRNEWGLDDLVTFKFDQNSFFRLTVPLVPQNNGVPIRFDSPAVIDEINRDSHDEVFDWEWSFKTTAYYGMSSAPISIRIDSGKIWQTGSYGVNVVSNVTSLNGIDLAGTPHQISAVVITVDNIAKTELAFGDFLIDSWSYDFQVDILGTVPEPSGWTLLILGFVFLGRQRPMSRLW